MCCALGEPIVLHNFSLITTTGKNVWRTDFERRRLAVHAIDRLALKFHAVEKKFEFELERSNPIFAPGATIKVTGVSQWLEWGGRQGGIYALFVLFFSIGFIFY